MNGLEDAAEEWGEVEFMVDSGAGATVVGPESVKAVRASDPAPSRNYKLADGSLTQVQIAMGDGEQTTLVPESALLEDYGNYSVVLQLGGESFERRPITIGKRNGKNVEVLKGLKVGDVVVTTGAYQVKMASMSGTTPAHGHDH